MRRQDVLDSMRRWDAGDDDSDQALCDAADWLRAPNRPYTADSLFAAVRGSRRRPGRPGKELSERQIARLGLISC
jgi:hypothetical protein